MAPDPRDGPARSRRRVLALFGAAVTAGLAGCSAPARSDDGGASAATTDSPDAGADTDPGGVPDASAAGTTPVAAGTYTDLYGATIPSVALVQVYRAGGAVGQGSGFVHPDGDHVVTNQHVVAGARTVVVRFHDGTWTEAPVRGADAYSDLAVLEATAPSSAPPLELVADDPPIGTQVVALGAPFSLDGSLSSGVVSGVDRSLPSRTGFSIPDAVQTDAAVNPGNSGGPLVDLDGRVVAVINSGRGENVNFGISAALTRRVVPALVETGSYDHSFVGVRLLDVTPAVARANDLDRVEGVLVTDVLPDGPAAGTLRGSDGERRALGRAVPVGGDVIRALDGEPTPTQARLAAHLAVRTSPGDTLDVRVVRDGSERTVSLELGARPPPG